MAHFAPSGLSEPDHQGNLHLRESRILAPVRPRMQAAGFAVPKAPACGCFPSLSVAHRGGAVRSANSAPAAENLSPPPSSCRQANLCFPMCFCYVFLCFSSTWGDPEVGGEDNCLGSYRHAPRALACDLADAFRFSAFEIAANVRSKGQQHSHPR